MDSGVVIIRPHAMISFQGGGACWLLSREKLFTAKSNTFPYPQVKIWIH